ncbi:DUF887 domain-containing protein [Cordyceps militaris CM01]|uniref:DUF887 domain-containing protein n=1 Tax=Cordyceps militaris (strain CM01) TaxID=983644 RepID=G3JN87_CORMM|nr:DUF887 domain-containing protein [Cordyceps militaris CM01]EGX90269.1 DUF887 domain-containing protein [Cordyceps militaris CM01]
MKDPFFFQPVPWLSDLVRPLSRRLDLVTLPLHIHEVIFAALLYSVIFYPISPILSRLIASKHYSQLSRQKRLNWDAHVVSMAQSIFINGLALWIKWVDEERSGMDREGRIWGYSGAPALLQSMAVGYFVWDLFVTAVNLEVFGIGTLAHAVSALIVFSLGFKPFVNYYGCNFILFELSTPFLNIHWFLDKVNMTGSNIQLYNGFALLFTFFACRLVYGPYQSYRVFSDIYALSGRSPSSPGKGVFAYVTSETYIPKWLSFAYLASNATLTFLNFYWFYTMIYAVRKRFVRSPGVEGEKPEPATEVEKDLNVAATGRASQTKPRSRRA